MSEDLEHIKNMLAENNRLLKENNELLKSIHAILKDMTSSETRLNDFLLSVDANLFASALQKGFGL